jgi:hypothetical protein
LTGAEKLDVALAPLLAGLREGRLHAIAQHPRGRGLLAFSFEAAAARHFLTDLRPKAEAMAISVPVAAKTLATGAQSVLWLAAMGLRDRIDEPAQITTASIERLPCPRLGLSRPQIQQPASTVLPSTAAAISPVST